MKASLDSAMERLPLPSIDELPKYLGLDASLLETNPASFPSLRSYYALTEKPLREGNDLMDMYFCCTALPYLDAVCVDKAMNRRIGEVKAKGSLAFEWCPSFSKLSWMCDWLEEES